MENVAGTRRAGRGATWKDWILWEKQHRGAFRRMAFGQRTHEDRIRRVGGTAKGCALGARCRKFRGRHRYIKRERKTRKTFGGWTRREKHDF